MKAFGVSVELLVVGLRRWSFEIGGLQDPLA